MAVRLEGIIIGVTVAIFAASYMVRVSDQNADTNGSSKELEFHNMTFLEVDQNGLKGKASAVTGVRESGVLRLDQLKYHTSTVELLRANRATLEEEKLYLDGNISLDQKEGFYYEAEHAIYSKKTKILRVTSPFRATLRKNVIEGTSLEYDTVHKEAVATMIDAVLYTTDSQETP